MACKSETRTFENVSGGEVVAFVRQLPATKALELQIELLNTVGTDVFPFVNGNYTFASIVRIMTQSEAKALSSLIKRVASMAVIDGKEVNSALFDSVYNGDLYLIYKIFAFVCEVNFKDFFSQGLETPDQKLLEGENQSEQEKQN